MDESQITRREAAKRLLMAAGAAAVAGCGGTAKEPVAGQPMPVAGISPPLKTRPGPQFTQRDAGAYEKLRQSMVWNGLKPDRRPDVIAQAGRVEHVQLALEYARQQKLKVAVRGGGHSWIGAPLRNGGLLLDVSGIDDVKVDPTTVTVTAGPGVKNQDLVKFLTPHKLAFPVGHCPGVRLSGYLLGGGFGWNSGVWGPACFSVRGVQVVTADGSVVNASETENPDLFWAARGAGAGFFGVVTQYTLQAHPLPEAIWATSLMFDANRAATVGAWLEQTTPRLAREVELTCLLGPPLDEDRQYFTLWAVAFAKSEGDARRMLSPLLEQVRVTAMAREPQASSFSELLETMGAMYRQGERYAVDMSWCNAGPAELLPHMAWAMKSSPSSRSLGMLVFPPAPPKDAPPPPDMALSRFGRAVVGIYGCTNDPMLDGKTDAWVKTTAASLNDISVGHYIGEANLLANKDRPSLCFSAEAWMKLRQLKTRYDPAGVFHDFPGIL